MKKLYVKGGDTVTVYGNLEQTWSSLLSCRQPEHVQLDGFSCPFPLAYRKETRGDLGSTERLDALLAELYDSMPVLPQNTTLICSTTKGAIDALFDNPHPETGQVWQLAEHLAKRLHIDNGTSSVSAACASGTIAIIDGAMRILAGECENALIIGFDLMSRFVTAGFASLKALSPDACRPFDKNRSGLALGEAAAWLLLTGNESVYNGSDSVYALTGWGISCDATHITAPCRNASGLIRTLQQIQKGRNASPGAINAHGTGTIYNDAMELLAFSSVFSDLPPICSVKGSIGHCLGAAGVVEALISLKSLETGLLPPTVGLLTPEDIAMGSISGSSPLALTTHSILSCNSGFGGINSGVLLERV